MLYLSLALIFLGIIIFLYSILLDAKRRHDRPNPAMGPGQGGSSDTATASQSGPGGVFSGKKEGLSDDNKGIINRGKRVPRTGQAEAKGTSGEREESAGAIPASNREQRAVLFEDKSHVIDYGSESGSIDPSLEEYKNIKRIGSGTISVESGGITFYMGKKLYRYDFHRIRDIKAGKSHLALFLMGSGSVKLFIVESGTGTITAATDAFRDYSRSSA